MYYAHLREDGAVQTVEEHLAGTARRCGDFAAAFGEEARGRFLGYAHDIGKCSEEFQRRLRGGPKVDHATAGALECAKRGENAMACCVAGHHGGLPDFGNPRTDCPGAPTCVGRIKKGAAGGIPACHWAGALPDPGKMPAITDPYALSMWVRMLYSCLVDADYLDTEAFMAEQTPRRGGYDSLPVLLDRLNAYIRPWFPGNTELNRKRCAILSQCLEKASRPRGIYSLTVPTGGGKTVSSLAFALKHAVENGLDRVIYVIPYTSIIEQNAAVFREILGENNVVEHHSGVRYDDDDETNKTNRFQRLAAENWDAPVVVTTAVQFFESLYSSRSSQCRKLHNIANSVVIFDEAQMIPTCHLLPCVGAMASLVSQFRATVLLCTATQPVLGDLLRRFCPGQQIEELCPAVAENFRNFRRVTYRDGGELSDEALAGELCREKQVLCIVNTRKAAREALKGGRSPGDPEMMDRYFACLRSLIGENIDKSGTVKTLREQLLPFETVSKGFRLIDQETFTVYIPLGEGEAACSPLLEGRASREDCRRAGQYSVSIYEKHFRDLLNAGDIQALSGDSAVLTNLSLYDPEMGLSLTSDAGKAEFI